MTANELLQKMIEAGFTVKVVGDKLTVSESRWIDEELAELIRQHKPELMRLLL